MGQKVHPIGFRLGVIRDADSHWFADKKTYRYLLAGDHAIRKFIRARLGMGNISRVDIERAANRVSVTLHTARPGAVIGRGGKGIDELTQELQKLVVKQDKNSMVHVNVHEVRQPELDAQLVAESIAQQLERRISHRRAMRQAVGRCLRNNGRGIKIISSGRLGGAEIARTEVEKMGKVPLHTIRADIDYGKAEAKTTYGVVGVRVWIYKGEVLPDKLRMAQEQPPLERERRPRRKPEAAEAPAAPAAEAKAAPAAPVEAPAAEPEVKPNVDA
ncbi:MAG: 30S ribosomal protein S3 [Fimbriimonadales bacterium]